MRPFSRSLTAVPPNLFGAYNRTGLMIALANVRAARRVELAKHFGAELVHSPKRNDNRGIILKWPIGVRGYALALNPEFPLASELRGLLRALSKEYPISVASEVTPEEAVIPRSAIPRQTNMEMLFDSPVRTLLLVTLEALGGKAVQRVLCHCVPGQFYNSLVTALRHFVRDGVLQRKGRTVSFTAKSWTPALRKLLRAYLREQPAVEESISRQVENERQRTKVLPQYHLLGPPSVERQLIALAQHGPLSYAEVMAAAKTHADRTFHVFEKMGIIASIRHGRRRLMTLNKTHPVYKELRALLLSLGGSSIAKPPNGRSVDAESYDVDRLFGRPLRTAVLLTLHASRGKQLDTASMHRLLPEYDVGKIAQALRRFEELGILGRRRWKTVIYYTFDARYPHYTSLQRLLAAINRQWPEYAAASAHTNELLYPDGRRRMHRYRH